MSANLESFRKSVNGTEISGNIDTPEGMFDALMQIAVCGVKISEFSIKLFFDIVSIYFFILFFPIKSEIHAYMHEIENMY